MSPLLLHGKILACCKTHVSINANFADLFGVFIFTDRNTKTKLQRKRQVSDGFRDRNSKSPNGKRELTR